MSSIFFSRSSNSLVSSSCCFSSCSLDSFFSSVFSLSFSCFSAISSSLSAALLISCSSSSCLNSSSIRSNSFSRCSLRSFISSIISRAWSFSISCMSFSIFSMSSFISGSSSDSMSCSSISCFSLVSSGVSPSCSWFFLFSSKAFWASLICFSRSFWRSSSFSNCLRVCQLMSFSCKSFSCKRRISSCSFLASAKASFRLSLILSSFCSARFSISSRVGMENTITPVRAALLPLTASLSLISK